MVGQIAGMIKERTTLKEIFENMIEHSRIKLDNLENKIEELK